jgi:hypothetical protein
MPTIVREDGFEVRIYVSDHPPPHVHVAKAGAAVKISLMTRQALWADRSMADHDVKRAEEIVARHEMVLYQAWRRLHGDGSRYH